MNVRSPLLLVAAVLSSAPLLQAPRALLATGSCKCGFCTGSPSATCCTRKCTTGCGGDHCPSAPTATPVISTPPTPTPVPPPHTPPTPTPAPPPSAPSPTPVVTPPPYGYPPPPPVFPPDIPVPPTPPPPPTPPITTNDALATGITLDIHPVQVIQDPPHEAIEEKIPLVEGKATMVRVFVTLPEAMSSLKNATCTLSWPGFPDESITADLVRAHGRIWVNPVQPADPTGKTDYEKLGDLLAKGKGGAALPDPPPAFLKADKFWAYNFTFGSGRACPAALTLTAKLDAKGVRLAKATEASGSEFKIRPFTHGTFQVLVEAFGSIQIPDGFIDPKLKNTPGVELKAKAIAASPYFQAVLAKKAQQYKEELLAVFPIPENAIAMTVNPTINFEASGITTTWKAADKGAGPWSFSRNLKGAHPNADTILLLTNPNQPSEGSKDPKFQYGTPPSDCDCAGWTPIGADRVHYITLGTTLTQLTAAHETNHDGRFWGPGHVWKDYSVEDGWDVGRRVTFTTTRGLTALMESVPEHPWIVVKEYKKLLDALTGGSDPQLVSFDGVLSPDGTLDVAPPEVLMGTAPRSEDEAGALLFADGRGKVIGTWRFALREEKGSRGFSFRAPLPPEARSMTLKLPGDVTRRFSVAARAPKVEWTDVQATPDGQAIRVKLRASHPDGLPVRLHFVYEPDGRHRIDLAAPGGGTPSPEILLPIEHLAGGRAAHLTVWAVAGNRLTESRSFPFQVPDRAPWLFVDEEPGVEGAARFTATAYDPEDGFALEPEWTTDGIALGRGAHPDAARLASVPAGRHRLRATVRDAAGHRVSAEVEATFSAPAGKKR